MYTYTYRLYTSPLYTSEVDLKVILSMQTGKKMQEPVVAMRKGFRAFKILTKGPIKIPISLKFSLVNSSNASPSTWFVRNNSACSAAIPMHATAHS